MKEYLKNKIRKISEKQREYLTETEIVRIKEYVKTKWEKNNKIPKREEKNIKIPEFYVSKFFD